MIIEQACAVEMVKGEKRDQQFRVRIEPIIDDLLFLGEMLIGVSESLAEQQLIEDVIEVSFDQKNLYTLSRKHHYEFIFSHIANKQETEDPDYVIDQNAGVDFRVAMSENFGIDYDHIWQVIVILMENWKQELGDCIAAECEGFLKDLQQYTKQPLEQVQSLLSGLTLTNENKMNLDELLRKPYALNRYLYKPFLIWTINKKQYYVFGIVSLHETENSLLLNAIPWGKFPKEWHDNKGFREYVHRKEDAHDKWLDDIVEENIKTTGLHYQRTVKSFSTKTKSYSMLVDGLGEIDFIIISPHTKKVYIADCKHLLGRYDMVNQKNDFEHFTKDGKQLSYNNRLKLKVDWMTENMQILEEHFQLRMKKQTLSLAGYSVEGVFFINTPTFYMYNADYRIYTYDQVVEVITGKYADPVFHCVVIEDDCEIFYPVKYPYFKKPKMLYYNNPDDECEVDKYGYPIRNKGE